MSEPAEGQPLRTWTLTRRQLLGGGVMGVAGLALASVVPAATEAAEPPPGVTGKSRVPSPPDTPTEPSAPGAPGAPDELAVDGLAVPIGLGPVDVYFAWQVRDARRGASQSAYRIQVSGPVVGPGPAPMVWDSGQVGSGEQAFVAYGGPGWLRTPPTGGRYGPGTTRETPDRARFRRCSRPGSMAATGAPRGSVGRRLHWPSRTSTPMPAPRPPCVAPHCAGPGLRLGRPAV